MGTIVVEKGRAEPLTFYPSSLDLALPTAADIRVGTPSTPLPDEGSETSLTANIDGVNTTLSAAASKGATSLVVTSATGITVGRRYLTSTARGEKFAVAVKRVDSTTIYLDEPLPADLATGRPFQGLAVTHTLTTGETNDLGVGHIVLRLTLNGVVRRYDYELRVEPRVFPLMLSTDEMLAHNEVRRMRSPTDLTLEDTRRAAWEMELKPRLNARGIIEHRITTPSVVNRPLLECVVLRLMRSSGASIEAVADQEMRVNRVVGDMLASQDYWYQVQTATVGRGDDRAHPQPSEFVRFTR